LETAGSSKLKKLWCIWEGEGGQKRYGNKTEKEGKIGYLAYSKLCKSG
jgi:hypothetical protein